MTGPSPAASSRSYLPDYDLLLHPSIRIHQLLHLVCHDG